VDLGIEIVPVQLSTASGFMLDVARRLGLTAYDAAYLGLAALPAVPLATLDDRLAAACRRGDIELAT
jgi:predicted nucleic acid-binding protein